ncbi:MAG: O-antigen ligase C-terminal domain-containing protein [Burkholderiales bacterium]|nr:O-antigen ligase C-terminal domain-containing protein [Burkholderiales bacterium]
MNSIRSLEKLTLNLGLVALALGWLLPGHYPPWVTYQQQWMAALGAALIAFVALVGGRASLRWPWLATLIALYAAVPLLQGLAGQLHFISDSVLPALYLVAFAVCMVSGAALARQSATEWIDALMTAVVVAALVSMVLALAQWLRVEQDVFIAELPPGGRPFGNLAQPNQLATLLALGIVGMLRFYELRRLGGFAVALVVACLGFGMVMTQSRTGWLFLAVLVLWWAVMRRRASLRLSTYAVVSASLLFVAVTANWEQLNQALLLATTGLEERLQPGLRGQHWLILLDAVSQSPWWGYGWLQVSTAQAAAALAHPATHEMLQDSHNVVLDLAVWMGVPLAAVFVAAVTLWLARQVRNCRGPETWTLLAAVGAILTHALLEYPLDYTFFLLPLGLLMGSIEGVASPTVDRTHPRWTVALPLAGLVLMLVWIGRECMQVEDSTRQLRFLMMGVGINRVSSVPPPDVVLLDAPREYHRYWLTPARAGMTDAEINWMRNVSQRNAFPPAMLRFALAAGLNGRAQESARTLALLCKVHPKERCDEGRASWAAAQLQYPVLRSIGFPGQ